MEGIIKLLGGLIEGVAMWLNRKHSSKTYKSVRQQKGAIK